MGDLLDSFDTRKWLYDYTSRVNRCVVAVFSARDLDVMYISSNSEELLGIRSEDIKEDVTLLFHLPADSTSVRYISKDYFLSIEPGKSLEQEELKVMNSATGETKYLRASIKRVDIEGGDYFLLILADRTEEVTRNHQMEDMIAVANAANDAKTRFLANMSHDFRTPMNAITNYNLLISRNSNDPQKIREYTHKIGLACQNLLSLLNDVLDMSKIESGKAELGSEEFALGLLLEEVNSVIAFQARGKEQDYQVHSGGMQQDLFIGDKKRINEILVNILGNAVKYTPKGGRIDFTISEEKASTAGLWNLRFEVKDNGIGMSKSFQDTIFDAFTRDDNVINSDMQGTGLGMAIANNLVHMMGGNISVDSEMGRGSTFVVTLRLQGVEQDKEDFWLSHGIRRILVIDEDLEECHKIETALHDTGVEVFMTTSGYKAMNIIDASEEDQKGFEVILLGMQIRSISCFEMAERIRSKKLSPQPLVLLLTEDWEEVADEARNSGVYDFLTKPFFLSTFRQLVEDILSRNVPQKEGEDTDILKGMRFLAAEDNEINADILTELLGMEDAAVERAENGAQVVEMFERSDEGYYDMILMDIQMPVVDGYQAARMIRRLERKDGQTIPIIAMTANAYADDVQKALDSGMDAHVPKPMDLGVLKETISSLKNRR